MGSLDISKNEAVPQVARLDKITSTTGPNIKVELDDILKNGWNLIAFHDIGGNTFAIFTRPKRQQS